jgi:hypothetical protein
MTEKTDLRKWKLHVDRGRQVWKYHPEQRPEEQKAYDKYFLGLDVVRLQLVACLLASSTLSNL